MDNELIVYTKEFKFLDLCTDAELKFSSHFSSLHDKLVKSCFVICSLSKCLPTECLRTLYFAYYHPHITYCLTIWWPMLTRTMQESLQKLQKRMIRSLCKMGYLSHCMPLFKKQEILTITDQVTVENCKIMFRVCKDDSPALVRNLYSLLDSKYNMRNQQISVRNYNTPVCNRSFLCKPVLDWQQLLQKLKEHSNKKTFVKSLK